MNGNYEKCGVRVPSFFLKFSGDSGGPLVFQDKLVGVVSAGNDNCTKLFPTVYASVNHYWQWIVYVVNEFDNVVQ